MSKKMLRENQWLSRPKAAVCVFTASAILAIFVLINESSGNGVSEEPVYRITLRHYGVDAGELERTIAVPLEDMVSAIPGIKNIVTVSENSSVHGYIRFRDDVKIQWVYNALREAAQRVYETLPPSAQRPELSSSDEAGIPVWIAAAWDFPSADYPERIVKPAFERIEGVASVEISGAGIPEIVISPDAEKIAALGLSVYQIAGSLGMNDAYFSGGTMHAADREILVTVDSRYPNLESLGNALIHFDGGIVRLNDIARIYETKRDGDTLSRLDGKKAVVIAVTAVSGINQGTLSRRIGEVMKGFTPGSGEFKILQDRGAEEAAAFHSVLTAALGSSVLVALAALFLIRKKRQSLFPGFVCAASIPFISIISAAFLSTLGFPLDKKLLAGLSIGIGTAADAVLLSADGFSGIRNFDEGGKILKRISIPLISSTATTIAALFPLSVFSEAEEISVIIQGLGTVALVSLTVAVALLPPLLIRVNEPVFLVLEKKPPFIERYLQRKMFRLLGRIVWLCSRKKLLIPLSAVVTSAAALVALVLSGTDISYTESGNSVYGRVEFEEGLRKEEGDRRLTLWTSELKDSEGILSIQTSARTGSGQVLVTFDSRRADNSKIREMMRSVKIPGGFLYIPEPSRDDRIWEVKIIGQNGEQCRKLAEKAAALCMSLPLIREVVLNFKEGNPRLNFMPDWERLAKTGTFFSVAADMLRRSIHGPVIYKRITEQGEIDIRLKPFSIHEPENFSRGFVFPDDLLSVPLVSGMAGKPEIIRFGSVSISGRDYEPSSIRREDRRRLASFSIRTPVMDPRRVKEQILSALGKLDLPPGYRVEFDAEAIRRAEALAGTVFRFFLALLFCYMVMAAANESFGFPLLVLLVVPPSLALPVLVLFFAGTPVNAAVACSLVAVSGMTVNAAIIVAGEFRHLSLRGNRNRRQWYAALRRCFPVLLSTGGTTVLGAVPFLFLPENGNTVFRTLSLITILGISASLLFSLALTPSLINMKWKRVN